MAAATPDRAFLKKDLPFQLGALVVPAVDSALRPLGYDVESLGLKGLGVVIEARKSKSLLCFPELNLSLWLSHDEMADVEFEAAKGSQEFASLIPDFSDPQKPPKEVVFWIWKFCKILPVKFILAVETGDLIEVWDQEDQPLDFYYKGDFNIPAAYIGLGVSEFYPQQWNELEKLLGPKLLFSRFLPSGMHKLEIALYVKT